MAPALDCCARSLYTSAQNCNMMPPIVVTVASAVLRSIMPYSAVIETPEGPQTVYVPINVDKCSAANKEAPWLQVQTLDQLKSRKPKEIHDFP
jgi:hypothetical protein